MAANPNVVPDGGSGAGSSPSEPASPQSQPTIESEVTKLLTGLGDRLGSLETQLRGLQGRQDKSESNFREQLARLNQYKGQGLSDDEALAEMEADDRSEQRWQGIESQIKSLAELIQRGGTQTNNQQLVATALTQYGLDPKDPFVAGKLAGQSPKDATEAELLAARIFRDKQLAPSTNLSQQSATPGAPPSGGLTPQQVEQKSIELQRLYDNYTANQPQIQALEKELKDFWATQK